MRIFNFSSDSISESNSVIPFVFNSTKHQRYQNGSPVMGLQVCPRTVKVENNTNGCPGYNIQQGVGVIVKIFNNDLNKPQMSDKPMKIVSKTSNTIELRGYVLQTQTPFGWMEVDYSCYGMTISYNNGNVTKCVFHMFDRGVDLCYM